MKTVDEIMKEISTLTADERNELFDELVKIYHVQVFPVGETSTFGLMERMMYTMRYK